MKIIPVILAGGSGTRLWPLSRELYPKQFMQLVGDKTLLQSTLLRLSAVDGIQPPLIVCNEAHRFIVAEQLREIDIKPQAIVLEPVGRNTAPAIAVAGLMTEEGAAQSILLVLPADHHIREPQRLVQAIISGARLAEQNMLVTFGIVPQSPETGYGYIRKGGPFPMEDPAGDQQAWHIDQFVEKPDLQTAQSYLSSGDYCWNSGMFLFKTDHLLEELQVHAPEILSAGRQSVSAGRQDLDFFRLDKQAFAACPSDSIDYAVMEKTKSGVMIALDCGWSDLGSWEALWQAGAKNGNQNVVHGDVCLQDVRNSFVHATSRLVTAVGLSDHVVVETRDAVFIAPRCHVQQVKDLVAHLKSLERSETYVHTKVYRPWGSYENVDVSERFQVKRIIVKPKAILSSQKHYHRAEHWVVVKGTARVTRGDDVFILKEDESTYIPLGTVHRLENPGKIPLELIEVQSGSYLGEDDIERFDDVYGRKDD